MSAMRTFAAPGSSGRLVSLVSLVSVVSFVATPARAAPPDADRCVAAYESTQRLRQAGRLREAKAEALTCSDPACPRVVRQDCVTWVDELQKATPTVVVRATGPDGCDVVDGRLVLDGEPVSERLDGAPIAVDPGVHTVRVEGRGTAPLEQRIAVVEGDHDRRVELTSAPPGTMCTAPRAPAPGATTSTPATRPTPPAAYVLGGLGVLGVGVGTAFAIAGFGKRSDLGDCKPRCNPDDVDSMRRTFVVSDVLIGVGIVALAGAAYFYFTRPPSSASAAWLAPDGLRF
jgi:hypothetical protein